MLKSDDLYFVVKVTSGQERVAANMLSSKSEKGDTQVYSIIVVEGMRGYIIIEAEDEAVCRGFIAKVRNVRGMLSKPISEADVERLVTTMSAATQEIEKNDTVEFTSGPFKGYKAKVLKVDNSKSEITVELIDVVVPIPVTTKMNTAKVIKKTKGKE
ncbi:MAG: transcription elongation factor Spt5 [Candidatus Marsarchaeota archaeon]|nr:transcription elongation factor Spt5 [Candidatus Marsarchaeota archaeon]